MTERVGESEVRKTFVLDTNVILHDSDCIRNFEEHDIAIPITVLEELDRFKKGGEDINFHARHFLRVIDELTGDLLSPEGAPLGEGLGHLKVVIGGEFRSELAAAFVEDAPDHRILNTALTVHREDRRLQRQTIFVTKDVNLRMKAKSFGLISQDYENDKIESFDALYMGKRMFEGLPCDLIGRFYQDDYRAGVEAERFDMINEPVPNENFILRNGTSASALATYDHVGQRYHRAEKVTAYGITPRNAEQIFALRALLDDDVRLVTLAGKAGSGKTLIALAAALQQRANFRQILLARPVVSLSNRDLGYLPGDVKDKLDPYMQPLYDNLNVIRHAVGEETEDGKRIGLMRETGKIEISPLAYIRGRSLPRIFFIVDEAQNLTPHEMKTIITRAGEGTKIIFTGDIHQIDHPYLDSLSNGLSYLINRMKGQPIYAHVTLEKGERSELAELASDLL
ncbi:PhoH family protein [Stratiformator vulcanicus]|uniref:PhoH-like protein n=1 Tax=Stratiformator vulcanicus TaxID=2527980 RepID=A0A517R4N0_9PLAN|nr:PhoH family protein [Stratiformator vulcanicus]QDT38838.1 PhoH-like protein [Stratiformator vulcanicus]